MTMTCMPRYGVVLALTLLLMGLFYGSFSLEGAYQAQYGLSALGCSSALQQDFALRASVLKPLYVGVPSLAYAVMLWAWLSRRRGVPLGLRFYAGQLALSLLWWGAWALVLGLAMMASLPVYEGLAVSDLC